MAEPAIEVHDLHKEFLLPQHKYSSLKERFTHIGKRNVIKHQKVLDGINFEVNKGDFFGIVGRNGSGKSTLLKILAGVYAPTEGEVRLHGALTPFIELGVGFNPELSGRDNVYLNGALLGFSRVEMAAMYDEIVEFAELGEFMDQKLKNYSSGMQVRLAFSIAIKAKNDILIFDEVLAVGDEAFQRKCLDIFEQYKATKQTVILVTHDMDTVRQFCSKAMLISEGKIINIGDPRVVARSYSTLNQEQIDADIVKSNSTQLSEKVGITLLKNGQRTVQYNVGETLEVTVEWEEELRGVKHVGLSIFKESGEYITGTNTEMDNIKISSNKLECHFRLDIIPGNYHIAVGLFGNTDAEMKAEIATGPKFTVLPPAKSMRWNGLIPLDHSWKV